MTAWRRVSTGTAAARIRRGFVHQIGNTMTGHAFRRFTAERKVVVAVDEARFDIEDRLHDREHRCAESSTGGGFSRSERDQPDPVADIVGNERDCGDGVDGAIKP